MSGSSAPARRFAAYANVVLIFTVAVIVWGAVVRATGSGAGCGAHWPFCNGVVVPLAPRIATVIEYVHRLTSGITLLLTAGLVAGAFRGFPPGHGVRRAAIASLVFVIVEAAVGAGIVLLRLVEGNASALRAIYISGHLVNTMLLTASMTATAWWAHASPRTAAPAPAAVRRALFAALVALVAVSSSGAVVALGDTLFPQHTLVQGLAADFDATSHFLIRLRVWHPLFATGAALYLVTVLTQASPFHTPGLARVRRTAIIIVVLQMALGAANVFLLAPLGLQMAHLVGANALWIVLIVAWLELRHPVA